jgi:PAS domain S-box-containing protein
MRPFWNSLKVRFGFIVLLAVIPVLVFVVFNYEEQRKSALENVRKGLLSLAGDVAHEQLVVWEMTRGMLAALAKEPAVQNLDPEACSQIFGTSFKASLFPFYANVGLIDRRGNLVCSVVPPDQSVNIANRDYFQNAIETLDFSVGHYQVGRVSGKDVICFGYPVTDDNGAVAGVVFASLNLSWFDSLSGNPLISEEGTLTVIDGAGAVLWRNSVKDKSLGKSNPEADIVKTVLAKVQGTTEAVGLDGKSKIYGFAPLWPTLGTGYVYTGVPKETVLSQASNTLVWNLTGVAASICVGLLAAWIFAYSFVIRRINRLVRASQEIAKGNLLVQTGLDENHGEVGVLGSAFERMAASLKQQEFERKRAEDALKDSVQEIRRSHAELEKEKYFSDSVIDSLPGLFYLLDERGRFLKFNRNFEKVSGYLASEISNMFALDLFQGPDRDLVASRIKEVFEKGESSVEAGFVTKEGVAIPYYFSGRMIEVKGGKCLVGMGIDIAERTRAKQACEHSERLYRAMFENVKSGVAVYESVDEGMDFVFKDFNSAAERISKIRKEDVIGKRLLEMFPSMDKSGILGAMQRVYQTGRQEHLSAIYYKDEQREGWRENSLYRLPNGEVVAIYDDVTARKIAADMLEQSEEKYRRLVETTTDWVWTADSDGRHTYSNPAVYGLLGYKVEEVVGASAFDFIHPEDKQRIKEIAENCIEQAVGWNNLEIRWLHKDGSTRWFESSATSILDAENRIVGFSGVDRDITDRKLYEEQLRDSDEKTRLLVEQSPIGIAIFQDGKYCFANPELLAIFGCESDDQILGEPIIRFVAPGHQRLFVERCKRHIEGKSGRSSYQVQGINRNGELFDMVLWPKKIDYEGQPAILAFVMDVTETKNLRDQLMRAQKMEAIGTLAGGIAHDFNNILQVILGYSELMIMNPALPDQFSRGIKSINKVAVNGADLVRRVLTFARKTENEATPLNLNDKITQTSELLRRTIPKMIQIELNLSKDPTSINADPSQIEQIIMNLAVNAEHAMPEGGRLVIETKTFNIDKAYCLDHVEAIPGQYILLSVSDTGHGIDRKTMERIFEPFFTTKGPGIGTGLGLSMVYGIVKQHGGHITCYSEPGTGTTFKIYFPTMDSDVKPDKVKDLAFPKGGTETILLVDDEESVRYVAEQMLLQYGYRVITASNGREALEIYSAEKEIISLVILDLFMPEMGGKECLRALLQIDPKVRALVASGFTQNGEIRDVLDSGAKGFVGKPFGTAKLLEKIRKIIDEE